MTVIFLPPPRLRGAVSVEEALARRRSVRDFSDEPLALEELSQLLWAAYGVSDPRSGFRTAPSAGALYPLEVYAAVGERGVVGAGGFVQAGVYRYEARAHAVELRRPGDARAGLYRASLEQPWVLRAPVSIVFTAVYERTAAVYGERGRVRYVHADLGHAAQNVYLQAAALGLGTVAVGAFRDEEVREVLGLPRGETPVYVMPVGRPLSPYRQPAEGELEEYFEAHRRRARAAAR
jgi:SagB-type dehydrogenase family enzyme